MEEFPKTDASHTPLTIQIMFASLAVDNMRGQRTYITELTVLPAHQIAIAHQRNGSAINLHNAMNNIMIAINPRQNHMPNPKRFGFLKDDALLTTNDEGKHALSVNG